MFSDRLLINVNDGFATITFNQPQKKNALDSDGYRGLTNALYDIAQRDDVYVTIITGNGDFFSAGADVKAVRAAADDPDVRSLSLGRLTVVNQDLARSLYTHPKILVAALNGPAIGLSAALVGWADFVVAVENAYLMTPFSTLGLVAEGGASVCFPRRMGLAKANEALIWGKKLTATDLSTNGFVNKVFPKSSDKDFHTAAFSYLREQFADLDRDSVLTTKQLIRATLPNPDEANIREVFEGAARFATGKPQAEFAKMAAKTKRHKL